MQQPCIVGREAGLCAEPPHVRWQRVAHRQVSVVGRQTNPFLRPPEGAVALDVPQTRTCAVAGAVGKYHLVAIVFVAHVGQRARMVTWAVHVAVQVLLQIPVVAQIPHHDATRAACEIKEAAEAAPPARGEHREQLRVLQHQLGQAVFIDVHALGMGLPIPLHPPACGAGDHDGAACVARERRGKPSEARRAV